MANKSILSKYDSRKLYWFRFAKLLGAVIIATLIVFNVLIGVSRVSGESMDPTLHDRQVLFFLRLGDNYERGDIVAIKMPSGDKYVKRVIAVSGDTIDFINGHVYVNNAIVDEPYAKGKTVRGTYSISYPYTVQKDAVFVLGDNREDSIDSRTFGPVVKSSIKGKVLFKN